MLFSSLPFLFCFLPLLLLFWLLLSQSGSNPSRKLLFLFLSSSLLFYALWGLSFLFLFLLVISFNYLIALILSDNFPFLKINLERTGRKLVFILAVTLNLLSLLWFKYSAFIADNIINLLNPDSTFIPPALPLGISFYTFIQIAWLYDIYNKSVSIKNFPQHALFSCGFPWLISGPIIREKDVARQLSALKPLSAASCAPGFCLFSIGLAKKLLLADSCGLYADNVFNAALNAWPVTFAESWAASFFYTFQLYFDFSGYTDMALGLGLILGLTLPQNFDSPYKSTGIIDFWRRWHITLGTWLKDFIYIPLGGNRKGKKRQYLNLFLTMFLGGIWHGAGWTYILWGAFHGMMLIINHAWRSLKKTFRWQGNSGTKILSIIFTFICLNFCWVVFRASNLDSALAIYKSMFNFSSINLDNLSSLLPHNYISGRQSASLLIICFIISFFMPNSHQIIHYIFREKITHRLTIKMSALFSALLAFFAVICSGRQSAFLYFQF